MKKIILISILLLAVFLSGCEKRQGEIIESDSWGVYYSLDEFKAVITAAKNIERRGEPLGDDYYTLMVKMDHIIYPANIPENYELDVITVTESGYTFTFCYNIPSDTGEEKEWIKYHVKELVNFSIEEGKTLFDINKADYEERERMADWEYDENANIYQVKENGTVLYEEYQKSGEKWLTVAAGADSTFSVSGSGTANLTYEELRALCQYTVIPLN